MLGIDENEWCKRTLGRAITTLQGYRQVAREWDRYVRERRKAGENGLTGMDYAKSLVPVNKPRTTSSNPGDHYERLDISRCTFITDDASSAQKKMKSKSVDVFATSPPYFPLKRLYGGRFDGLAVGWEATGEEYLNHLVTIFRESKRVLKRRGTLVVVMGDSYSTNRGARYRPNTYKLNRPSPQKLLMPTGMPIQASDRPHGNLLLIPARFAQKMQDDGWILRMALPWDKGASAEPESVKDRTTMNYEWVLIFSKQRNYHWDQDAIRKPFVGQPSFNTRGKTKAGVIRTGRRRDVSVKTNPNGRNSGSVLRFNVGNYQGPHTAPLPEGLAHWILSATCDDNAVVCDPFGGAGTFAMVACQMGYTAITIDIFDEYTREAIERLSNAPAEPKPLHPQPDERIRQLEAERDDLRRQLEHLAGQRLVEAEDA